MYPQNCCQDVTCSERDSFHWHVLSGVGRGSLVNTSRCIYLRISTSSCQYCASLSVSASRAVVGRVNMSIDHVAAFILLCMRRFTVYLSRHDIISFNKINVLGFWTTDWYRFECYIYIRFGHRIRIIFRMESRFGDFVFYTAYIRFDLFRTENYEFYGD